MQLVRRSMRLIEDGRLDEVRAMYHPDLVPEGRRRIVAVPTGTSQEAWAEYMKIWLEQFSRFVVEPVAVRGDRIAAYRQRSTNEAGDEVVLLTALEIDESDRVIRLVMFDEEDEVAAIDLLDEWYIEGEGAPRAAVLTADREGFREYHATRLGGIPCERAAPDFVFVDHRPLPWPMSDIDGLLRLMQERVEQAPDVQSRVRKLFVHAAGRSSASATSSAPTSTVGSSSGRC